MTSTKFMLYTAMTSTKFMSYTAITDCFFSVFHMWLLSLSFRQFLCYGVTEPTLLWIRADPDMEYLAEVHFNQPVQMWVRIKLW